MSSERDQYGTEAERLGKLNECTGNTLLGKVGLGPKGNESGHFVS